MKARLDDEIYSFYLPVSDVNRDDRWHTSGMRGTSSDSFRANDVFVPEALGVPMNLVGTSTETHPDEPFMDYPYIATVSITCSAVVLGAAEAAVDLFEQKMRSRVLVFSANEQQVEQPFAQMRLGEADLRITMARKLWDDCIQEMDLAYGTGGRLTVAERVGIRAKCALVVRECREIVSGIMNAAGRIVLLPDCAAPTNPARRRSIEEPRHVRLGSHCAVARPSPPRHEGGSHRPRLRTNTRYLVTAHSDG